MNPITLQLIPEPREVVLLKNSTRRIRMHFILSCENFIVAKLFNERLEKLLGFSLQNMPENPKAKITFAYQDGLEKEEYILRIENTITLFASTHIGMLYGAYTLLQLIDSTQNNIPYVEIKDCPAFVERGYYHDITRGKMPTMQSLKELIDTAAYYKYNQFQFYIEHCFAFEGLEQVWFDKCPLQANDVVELQSYAQERGIDLIPSITTFGHMYEILRTQKYKDLCERNNPDTAPYSFVHRMGSHTINPFHEEAFALVCKMIDQYLPLFHSQYFNICCDETFDLCCEKNKDSVPTPEHRYQVYCDFSKRIANYVKGKGKTVMMWDDILLRGDFQQMPNDIVYLDWDYSAEPSEENRKAIAQKPHVQVCAGTSSWNRLLPNYDVMFKNSDALSRLAMKYGIQGYCLTCWGDFGDILKHKLQHLSIAYNGAVAWEGRGRENKEEFLEHFGWFHYKDKQLPGILLDIAEYQIVNWHELVLSLDKDVVQKPAYQEHIKKLCQEQEKLDYAKLSVLEEILYSKLVCAHDRSFILEMLTLCQGVRAFNLFDLQNYTYHGSFDKLCKFWHKYCEQHRAYNQEAELSRATEVIRALMLAYTSEEK